MRPLAAIVIGVLLPTVASPAVDLSALWDFGRPEVSEQRFREALSRAVGDDALILQTQIARTYGLRGDFERARSLLSSIAPAVADAGAEARCLHALELGRTFSSATHAPASQTPQAKAQARAGFERAREIARTAGLDDLEIDAIHMMVFVDTAPAAQIDWNRQALAVAVASSQPKARAWEASLRNNLGVALHASGRFEEALVEFRSALALREQAGQTSRTRVARWMVAWTLRALGRDDEALAIQHALERELDAAGEVDRHVFDELEALYRARGDSARAAHYAARRAAAGRD